MPPARLAAACLRLTSDAADIAGTDLFIVTVPTPLDAEKRPDLGAVLAASRAFGTHLGKGTLVVFESTVWPGVTEEVCVPVLERASGLAAGVDFHVGYSPERINPGDPTHGIDRVTKVVAGQTPAVAETLAAVYGKVSRGRVFVARDIRTAEAAKVIENAQHDINIAFVNELARISCAMGLSAHDVLEVARTKWNFLDFRPGLVVGHCIGVDPHYRAHRAAAAGHEPEILLAGRRVNDSMGAFIVAQIEHRLEGRKGRSSSWGSPSRKTFPTFATCGSSTSSPRFARGFAVDVHDPLAHPDEAKRLYGIDLAPRLGGAGGYACVVGAVAHDSYRTFTTETFESLLAPGGLVVDVKDMWRGTALPDGARRWTL